MRLQEFEIAHIIGYRRNYLHKYMPWPAHLGCVHAGHSRNRWRSETNEEFVVARSDRTHLRTNRYGRTFLECIQSLGV